MRWFRRQGTDGADASDAAATRDERLSAYLDGELSTTERRALEVELAADASMREALEGMRAVQTALAGLGEVRAPRAFTLTAPPVRTARSASRLEWITRLGAVASAAACALLLTTSGGIGDFAAVGTSMSQTTAERASAPEGLAAATTANDAAGGAGSGSAEPAPRGAPGAPAVSPNTTKAGAAESAVDNAAPAPGLPQAPASNPPRASTPDAKSAGGAGGGIVTPGSTPPPAGAALASAPAASATPAAGGATSAAASAPSAASPTPSAVTAAAAVAPTVPPGVAPATIPQAPAGAPTAPTAVVAAQAAPSSTPAARPGAPEIARTSAPIPQPNEVTTYGTERDGATSQLEEPSSAGGSATSTGTLAAVLAGLAAVLGVTAVGQWITRRRS